MQMNDNQLPVSKKGLGLLLVILCVTIFAFWPALHNDFTHWDDDTHLTENTLIQQLSFSQIKEIFTSHVVKLYIPLTLLSFAVEYKFFGYSPFVYHFDNLLLHLGVVSLVFFFVLRVGLSLRVAALAALLFGIHPMHVESVAWITERKDVLYALFYMLALNTYWQYLENRKASTYILTIIFGLFSILAKPMALSLPFIFLLCDWYYGRKFKAATLLDKIPHLLYIVPVIWLTYSLHARVPGNSFTEGMLIWLWTFTFYIEKFLFPVLLVPLYQLPKPVSVFNIHFLMAVLIACSIIIGLWHFRRHRLLLFAFLFYFLSNFFLFRFDDVVDISIVADRFMYLPSLGFCILGGAVMDQLLKYETGKIGRIILRGACVLLLLLLSVKTYTQSKMWKNDLVLWNYVIGHTQDSVLAHNNRGTYYSIMNQHDLALNDFNKALQLDPDYLKAYVNRAVTYGVLGQYDAALLDLNRVLSINPDLAEIYNNRGNVYFKRGKYDLALADFDQALAMDPSISKAYYNRANLYLKLGKEKQALENYNQALAVQPSYIEAYNNRGIYYTSKRQYDLAIHDFDQALKIQPKYTYAYLNRGNVYRRSKKHREAIRDYTMVLRMDPELKDGYYGRAMSYLALEQHDLAIADFTKLLTLHPQHSSALWKRGNAHFHKGELDAAFKDYSLALILRPEFSEVYNNRGVVYKKRKQYDLALADFDEAISLNAKYIDAYNNRATVYMAKGEYVQALEDLNKVLEFNPDHLLAYYNRGVTNKSVGSFQSALADFNKVLEINPRYSEAYFQRSIIYKEQNNIQQALEDALRAKQLGYSQIEEYINELKNITNEG